MRQFFTAADTFRWSGTSLSNDIDGRVHAHLHRRLHIRHAAPLARAKMREGCFGVCLSFLAWCISWWGKFIAGIRGWIICVWQVFAFLWRTAEPLSCPQLQEEKNKTKTGTGGKQSREDAVDPPQNKISWTLLYRVKDWYLAWPFAEAEKNHSTDLFRASRFKKGLLTNALSGVPEAKHKHRVQLEYIFGIYYSECFRMNVDHRVFFFFSWTKTGLSVKAQQIPCLMIDTDLISYFILPWEIFTGPPLRCIIPAMICFYRACRCVFEWALHHFRRHFKFIWVWRS